MQRVPQPPLNPSLRASEEHDFWPGLVLVVAGAVFLFSGFRHVTGIDTVTGGSAWETQLIHAFSSGGLQHASKSQAAPPPKPADPGEDPSRAAAALDRWSKQQVAASALTWKVRVDTGAKTPCPT